MEFEKLQKFLIPSKFCAMQQIYLYVVISEEFFGIFRGEYKILVFENNSLKNSVQNFPWMIIKLGNALQVTYILQNINSC